MELRSEKEREREATASLTDIETDHGEREAKGPFKHDVCTNLDSSYPSACGTPLTASCLGEALLCQTSYVNGLKVFCLGPRLYGKRKRGFPCLPRPRTQTVLHW